MHRTAPRPRRPSADVVTAVATAGAAAGAVVVATPEWFGLAGTPPFAWAVPFRVPLGLGLAALAGVGGLAGLRWRRALPAAAAVAVVAAASLTVTAHRGLSAGELPPALDGDVTVVASNVLHARADRDAVAALVVDAGAQVVSLPEATRAYAEDVAARVEAASGRDLQVFFTGDRGGRAEEGTALLVGAELGEYRQTDDFAGSATAVTTAVPVSGDGPPLAAVHTTAPVPGNLREWSREVPAVSEWCAAHPGALAAGDFNATVDHPGLGAEGGCVDAGAATGTGARGTWPSDVPAVLGATIDHALADGSAWRAVGTSVRDVPGTDHRALVARWRPTA
ncbi:endonuclease/exonuclease/phosphatase family protein [Kineococcus auxinigenes]|uniref:endonuclease/exonuclease/phosphatase family protein n=1 Tax=unclassified Kineococcus TaxID=2621656 RepID=UPI003D7C48DD